MLECVGVELHVVVVVVGVGEEVAGGGEDIGGRHVWCRESEVFGSGDLKHLFGVVGEVSTKFVAEIGVGVFFAHDFDGVVDAD